MSDGTTFVLGWDGLDYKLCQEFGLADDFVPHHTRSTSLDNEVLEKPDTYELWPSIITGTTSDEHGVYLISNGGRGAGAENPIVDAATGFMHRNVSAENRVRIAIALRNRGLRLNQKKDSWYRKQGVSTVFDGYHSHAIGIPNYRTREEEDLELFDGWGEKSSRFLKIEAWEDEEKVVYRPRKSLDRLEDWLISEVGTKERIVRTSAKRDYDLVFVWFAYIDTVGHTEPAVGEKGWQRRAYENAADVTQAIHSDLSDEDTLVVLSDHGNRGSDHTHDAFFGSTDESAVKKVENVLDYRGAIEGVTHQGDDGSIEIDLSD